MGDDKKAHFCKQCVYSHFHVHTYVFLNTIYNYVLIMFYYKIQLLQNMDLYAIDLSQLSMNKIKYYAENKSTVPLNIIACQRSYVKQAGNDKSSTMMTLYIRSYEI